MQGAPNHLEGFRKHRAHEGVPVTAGETGEVAWAFLKVVSPWVTIPLLIFGAVKMAEAQGGAADFESRAMMLSMQRVLGEKDPMTYLQIIGPWLALFLTVTVAYLMILNGFNSGEARLKKANGDAHRREKRRRLGIPEDW